MGRFYSLKSYMSRLNLDTILVLEVKRLSRFNLDNAGDERVRDRGEEE